VVLEEVVGLRHPAPCGGRANAGDGKGKPVHRGAPLVGWVGARPHQPCARQRVGLLGGKTLAFTPQCRRR
jgi:hypothetical protein